MGQKVLDYLKGHSHAILGTIAIVQNLHVLKGTAGSVLDAISSFIAVLASGSA